MPLILVRHAWAGKRSEWEGGDDSKRPLDTRGEQQAQELIERLAPYPVEEIHTSPYMRCVQTVVPLAAARGLEPILRDELGEDQQWRDGAELVRALAGSDVVVCGHGGLEVTLVDPPKWRKGAAFVVDDDLRVVSEL
jgi:phosphohistidine phosphatase SixA